MRSREMTRHAKMFGSWAVFVLALGLLLPAAAAAEERTKTAAPGAPGAAAAKPALPSKPPAPASPSPAPAVPSSQETEPALETTGQDESWIIEDADDGEKIAILSDLEIPPGKEIRGSVVCVGGNVRLLGKVRGDVVVIGGKLEMSGQASGSVVGVASKLVLRPGASVRGDLVNVAGGLDRDGARVGGQVVNIGMGGRWFAHMPGPFGILGFLLFWIAFLKLVLVFIGLLLLTAIAPDRVRLLGEEAPIRPFLAFFAGLGGYIVLTMVMILLCITIIGIPVALLLYFAFVIVKWLGLAGIFQAIGRRIGRLFGRELSLLGAVLLGFLPLAILRFIPLCVGSIIWFVLDATAVGLVILTRFGTRRHGALAAPPAPPPPAPVPPVPAP
jgi:hypothetical protein